MKPFRLSLAILGVAAFVVPFGFVACDDSAPASSSTVGDASVPTSTSTATGDASPPPAVDGGATPVPTPCAQPTAGPTTHGASVSANETWTADKSPHYLPYDTSVYATLTIEPCARVLIAGGRTVTVGVNAKIIANGDATHPIVIERKDAAPWASIRTNAGGSLSFAYVTIDGGGDKLNTLPDYAGALDLQGDQTLPTQPLLSVKHVQITNAASNGIVLHTGAGFSPDSEDLKISTAANYPISMWSRAVDGVPSGDYTKNAHDEILLWATGLAEGIHEDATMHNRGVPYHIGHVGSGGTLYIGTGSPGVSVATLTVEAGVQMRVKKGGVIKVESSTGTAAASGAMIAQGTSAAPIVFTSAEAVPAAGDWLGIWYGELPKATNKLDWAQVEFAGGKSSSGSAACNVPLPAGRINDGAIRIFGAPTSEFITNTKITDSANHGIDRGWIGPSTDFVPTNSFARIALCTQSFPRSVGAGVCPAPLPPESDPAFCPKAL